MVVFTEHAVQRYIERVIPGRDDSSARHDLDLLLAAGLGVVTDAAPEWADAHPGEHWLRVGYAIAFPLWAAGPHLVAATCLTRSRARPALRRRAVYADRIAA